MNEDQISNALTGRRILRVETDGEETGLENIILTVEGAQGNARIRICCGMGIADYLRVEEVA